jgi:hypothetical protein
MEFFDLLSNHQSLNKSCTKELFNRFYRVVVVDVVVILVSVSVIVTLIWSNEKNIISKPLAEFLFLHWAFFRIVPSPKEPWVSAFYPFPRHTLSNLLRQTKHFIIIATIVSCQWTEWMDCDSSTDRGFCSLPTHPVWLWIIGAVFPGIKWPEHKADHSLLFIAGINCKAIYLTYQVTVKLLNGTFTHIKRLVQKHCSK